MCLIFSVLCLSIAVTDVSAADNVLVAVNVNSGAVSASRTIHLTGTAESTSERVSGTENFTLNNSAHNVSYDGKIGTINASSTTGSATVMTNGSGLVNGVLSYQIDTTYTLVIPLGVYLDPSRTYAVDVAFTDISGITVSSVGTARVGFSGIESSVSVGAVSAVMGENWRTSLGGTGLTGDSVTVLVKASYICNVPSVGADFELGFSTSNISVIVRDYGEKDQSTVVGAINQGTASQDRNNELQEEQNQTSKNIFDKISDFFAGFFDGIINAFKSLFIPDDGYFSDFFTRLNDFFSEKLGALYTPIDLFIRLLQAIQNASVGSVGIPFPGIEWDGTYIIEPQTVNLQSIADDFDGLQDKIYFVTDVIMVGAVIWLLQSKLREVLKG